MEEDYGFLFRLMCRSCGTPKSLKLPAYPYPIGSLLPGSYGKDACCIKCGKAELEILNTPPQDQPEKIPQGWYKDPRKKK